MGISVGTGKGGPKSDMNIVPLIDILLVLIIIFMVINPSRPVGLDALVPQPNPNAQQPDQAVVAKTVVVQLLPGDALKINEEVHTWQTLGPRIEEIFKQRAEKVAFVKGDESIQFAPVARAIDIMRSNGVDKVGLITAKIEAGE